MANVQSRKRLFSPIYPVIFMLAFVLALPDAVGATPRQSPDGLATSSVAPPQFSGASSPASNGPNAAPLALGLSLFDGSGLSRRMQDLVRDEIETVLGLAGVQVQWVNRGANPYAENLGVEMHVIIIDVQPERWGMGERVMGTVLGNTAEKRAVYVFYPSVIRTLTRFDVGLDGSGRAVHELGSESADTARALARVAVHELIHVMTPSRPHAESGLMKARLNQHELVAKHADLDEASIVALQAGLGALLSR